MVISAQQATTVVELKLVNKCAQLVLTSLTPVNRPASTVQQVTSVLQQTYKRQPIAQLANIALQKLTPALTLAQ